VIRRRRAAIWCTVLVLTLPTGGLAVSLASAAQRPPEAASYLVTRVVDGDTIVLERIGRVRLIGVDTPESVDPRRPVQRFGQQAGDFTRRLVGGKRVRVEYDRARKDRYNRTLAYIYLADGTLVNAEIIRQGYGVAYTRFPFKYLAEFRKLERDARGQERGLWAPVK
jgi:micrococcal nuclease